jgi:hypothetical protein
MPRQVLPVTQSVINTFLNIEALPLVPVPADGCIVDAGISEHVMLVVTQTDAAAHEIYILAQDGLTKALKYDVGANTGAASLLFDTVNYEIMSGTDKGKIYIDFEVGFVGTICAVGTLK